MGPYNPGAGGAGEVRSEIRSIEVSGAAGSLGGGADFLRGKQSETLATLSGFAFP